MLSGKLNHTDLQFQGEIKDEKELEDTGASEIMVWKTKREVCT